MSFLTVLLGFGCIGALLANPLDKCQKHLDLEALQTGQRHINPDELVVLCPMIIPFMDCMDKLIVEQTGFTIEELPKVVPLPEITKAAAVFSGTRGVFQELCRENSPLNKAYNKHLECYQSIPDTIAETCLAHGILSYNDYKESVNEDIAFSSLDANKQCLTLGYTSGCVAAKIYEKCGMEAFKVYQEIIKMTQIFKYGLCSQQGLVQLKTAFLDALNLDDNKKEVFRLAFDLRRRKK